MPTSRHIPHNSDSRAQRQSMHARRRGDHRSPDPGECEGFLCAPEGDRNISLRRRVTQRSFRRDPFAVFAVRRTVSARGFITARCRKCGPTRSTRRSSNIPASPITAILISPDTCARRRTYNAACPMPTNVAGFAEAEPLLRKALLGQCSVRCLRADGNERLACLTQLGVEHEVEA
jgi:hypothetical protein